MWPSLVVEAGVGDRIYLYNDRCIATRSPSAIEDYLALLALLLSCELLRDGALTAMLVLTADEPGRLRAW